MKKCILLIICLNFGLFACQPRLIFYSASKWKTQPNLLNQIPVEVIDTIGAEIHLSWEIPNKKVLWQHTYPSFNSFQTYQADLNRALGLKKLDSLRLSRSSIGQIYEGKAGTAEDQNNAQMVLEGKVGKIRSINCLEAHLLNYQLSRYALFEQATEFGAFLLKKDKKIKIYFSASDTPWPPKDHKVQPKIKADIKNGWKLFGHLHNHYNSAEENYLGVLAPSLADAHYFKGKRDYFKLEKAFITNLFNTVEIDSSEFNSFHSH